MIHENILIIFKLFLYLMFIFWLFCRESRKTKCRVKKRGWGAPKLFIEKVKHKRFLYFQVFIFSWLTRQYTTPPWGGLLSLYVYTNKNTLTQLVSYGSYVLMLASQAAISSSTSAAVRGVGGGWGGVGGCHGRWTSRVRVCGDGYVGPRAAAVRDWSNSPHPGPE